MTDVPATRKQDPLDAVSVMDAVDAQRRRLDGLERESGLAGEDELVGLVRETYLRMGRPVPETTVRGAVRALRGERLAHVPMRGGPARWLATAYVRRARAYAAVGALALLGLGWTGAERVLVEWPAERAREVRAADAATTAAALREALDGVLATNPLPADAEAARAAAAAGTKALDAGDPGKAQARLAEVRALRAELEATFAVTVVSRADERFSVLYRTPRGDPQARSYYAVVEALGPDGRPVPRTVRDIETGRDATVTRWGQRIGRELYDAIAKDKQADGHVDDAVVGTKARGRRQVEWRPGVMEGVVTRW